MLFTLENGRNNNKGSEAESSQNSWYISTTYIGNKRGQGGGQPDESDANCLEIMQTQLKCEGDIMTSWRGWE